MDRTVILDYGMGNLRSVQKAFEAVGHTATITADVAKARSAGKLVLPGVGAFRDAIAKLKSTGLDAVVVDHIVAGKPFLGICLGLQLLFTRSFEDGEHAGLDILKGDVVRFQDQPGLKIPHMGWNTVRFKSGCLLAAGLVPDPSVYFVHGFFAVPQDESVIAGRTDYGGAFASAIHRGNILATQFHPEKSQTTGLTMLKNFATI
jgi:imidazole glycerol-phosphate synthase subunit HisH